VGPVILVAPRVIRRQAKEEFQPCIQSTEAKRGAESEA
jgi:hypothetical protein